VIRGGTPHFDFVAGECSRGLANVGLKYGLPVIFGVLTTDTIDQALERAGSGTGNKGFDTAVAALQMIALLDRLRVE
ncbi:MAG: 6,7-dimethyl-8-ribityllumazine synthase, partial [Lysobacterales bacterium]